MTSDVLQGSPRLDGHRLAVGDVVSSVDINENLSNYLLDCNLNINQIQECLEYCRTKQCVVDSPNKFCHNCTIRVQQDNDVLDDEQDNWLRAEKLFRLFFSSDNNASK